MEYVIASAESSHAALAALSAGDLASQQGALLQQGAQGAVFCVRDELLKLAVATKRIAADRQRPLKSEVRAVSKPSLLCNYK